MVYVGGRAREEPLASLSSEHSLQDRLLPVNSHVMSIDINVFIGASTVGCQTVVQDV